MYPYCPRGSARTPGKFSRTFIFHTPAVRTTVGITRIIFFFLVEFNTICSFDEPHVRFAKIPRNKTRGVSGYTCLRPL